MELIPNNQSMETDRTYRTHCFPAHVESCHVLGASTEFLLEVFVGKKAVEVAANCRVLEPFFSQEILHHSEWKKNNLEKSMG